MISALPHYCCTTMAARIGIPDLLRFLAAGCSKLDSAHITDRCDVHCPDLPRLFMTSRASHGTDSALPGRIIPWTGRPITVRRRGPGRSAPSWRAICR